MFLINPTPLDARVGANFAPPTNFPFVFALILRMLMGIAGNSRDVYWRAWIWLILLFNNPNIHHFLPTNTMQPEFGHCLQSTTWNKESSSGSSGPLYKPLEQMMKKKLITRPSLPRTRSLKTWDQNSNFEKISFLFCIFLFLDSLPLMN